jgi:hypothetical protein
MLSSRREATVQMNMLPPQTTNYNLQTTLRPPLWSSGQSSWLQIRRPGFDSLHYQGKKIVGLERGPLSLVSTTEPRIRP